MNRYQQDYDIYKEQVINHNGIVKQKVLDSAKKIISLNNVNGNFLTRQVIDGTAIVFSKWEPINLRKTTKNIKVQRTEYTLDEIYENTQKENGSALRQPKIEPEQMDIFSFLDEEVDMTQDESDKETHNNKAK